MKQEMRSRAYSRIVIDSLTSLRYFYIRTSEQNTTLMSFFRTLSDLGVTCLMTIQLPEVAKPDVESHVSRGEIRMHKWFNGRGLMRGITVEKYRGSYHDHRLRTMKMSDEGIMIKQEADDRKDKLPEPLAPEEVGEEDADAPLPPEPPSSETAQAPPPPDEPAPPPPTEPPNGGDGI